MSHREDQRQASLKTPGREMRTPAHRPSGRLPGSGYLRAVARGRLILPCRDHQHPA